MSARRILGLEQTLTALPTGNRGVIIEPKTEKATRTLVLQCRRVVHPVGKTIPEVHQAYLAGFIDGDGAIMALLERHRSNGSVLACECGSKRPSYVSRTCSGCARNLALARFKQVTVAGSGWSKTSLKHTGFFKRFDHLRA